MTESDPRESFVAAHRSGPEIGSAIAALWAEHRDEALARVAVLEDVASALAAGELDPELREEGRAAAHKLRGSAGTYGFERASAVAGQFEDALGGPDGLDLDQVPELSRLVLALREELDREPAIAAEPMDDTGAGEPTVVLITSDEPLASALVGAGARAGTTIVPAPGDRAAATVDERSPRLVLLDLGGDGSSASGFALLSEIASRPGGPPVFVLAGSGGLVDRVEAIRRGARGFFSRSLDPDRTVAAVGRFAASLGHANESILAVDDDPSVLAALQAILERRGYHVATLSDPSGFLESLEGHAPDLVLLDLDMPQINGLELCQAVRSDPAWAGLPLLILTAYREPEVVRRAFVAGADDYLSKPIVEEELAARVRNRLDRVGAQRLAGERDPLTGLLSRPEVSGALRRAVELSAVAGQPLSAALLDVDGLGELNRHRGEAAGDAYLCRLSEALREEFEAEPVGRWDGGSFLVAMAGLGPAEALRRVTAVLERLGARGANGDGRGGGAPTTVSAGVAATEAGAAGGEALVVAAEHALAAARRTGRGRVVADQDGDRAAGERTDIAIVEDDDSVVDVLRLALDDEGLHSRRLADGFEAVGALAADPPALEARVVLLDWDLPGLDGLSVLRSLRDSGTLERTRAIMVTARATEGEMLSALDLGASDCVPKPFSVPVLMEKVRRAMDS